MIVIHDHDQFYNPSSMNTQGVKRVILPPLDKFFDDFPVFVYDPLALNSCIRTLGKILIVKNSCSSHSFVGFNSLLSKGERKHM